MKNVLFLVSHLGSGFQVLTESLIQHPNIQAFHNESVYNSPYMLVALTAQQHKQSNAAAIYLAEAPYNYVIASKAIYPYCKFIHLIREPRASLNLALSEATYLNERTVFSYYRYRLRRICEIAKRTPQAVLLTWEDLFLGKGMDLISDYLQIKNLTLLPDEREVPDVLDLSLIKKAQASYERHLYFLNNFNLRRC